MSFKILKVIFVILLLITLGEAGYYVYILKLNQNQEVSGKLPASTLSFPSPTIDPTRSNFLVNKIALDGFSEYLLSRQKNNAQKFFGVEEVDGIIGSLEEDKPNVGQFILSIIDNEGTRVVNLTFDKNHISGVKFIHRENGNDKRLNLNDLKVNDKIYFKVVNDLINSSESPVEYIIN